jgi:L-ascorbate metabolism protein UlaG (beta-lactamase superfamily)
VAIPIGQAAESSVVVRPALDLTFVGHATVLIEAAGIRILTDPFLRQQLGPLVRHGPPPSLDTLGDVDMIVISHGHPDHFDLASLGAVAGRPLVVLPRGLAARARRAVRGDVIEVSADERIEFGRIAITAVPARHWITPGAPPAQPLGYLLDVGTTVYFAGDTGRFPAMRRLRGAVDVALLPIWTWGPHLGPGHLGPRSAAEVLSDIEPAVAVPIHWGTLYPRQLHRVWRGPLEEPGDRFAAHAARLAPAVDVRVLRPGERTTIGGPVLIRP